MYIAVYVPRLVRGIQEIASFIYKQGIRRTNSGTSNVRSMHTILSLGIGLFCSSVYAGTMGPDMIQAFDGFYIGGTVGVANFLDKESTLYTPGLYDRHQLSATGFIGGGIVGYDYSVTNRIKLGIEGFINGNSLNTAAEQKYAPIPSFNASMPYNAGVRLIPGYELTPGTIGQVFLGYSYGTIHIKDNGNYGYIDTNLLNSGFQTGLGIYLPCIFQNVSLRASMLYTSYGTNTSLGLSTSFTPQNYYDNFASLEGNLSLIYKFL